MLVSARADLSFGKGRRKRERHRKGQGQLPRSTVASVVGGPTTPERTKSEDQLSSLRSKATFRTRYQLPDRANQIRVSFLTNTAMILMHPQLSRSSSGRSDRASTLDADSFRHCQNNARAVYDNDEIWTIEADHRTGWGKERIVACCVFFLRDYPKQVVSLT